MSVYLHVSFKGAPTDCSHAHINSQHPFLLSVDPGTCLFAGIRDRPNGRSASCRGRGQQGHLWTHLIFIKEAFI